MKTSALTIRLDSQLDEQLSRVAEQSGRSRSEIAKPPRMSPSSIRDRDDRWVLATAVVGHADILVTGDDDLLTVAKDAPVPILAPRAFWELLRKGSSDLRNLRR